MTATEAARVLNSEAVLTMSQSMRIDVRITDAKTSFGVVRFYVTPVSGWGGMWVDASRVRLSRGVTEATWQPRYIGGRG